MTTVRSKTSGRVYEVTTRLYGTCNTQYTLSLGGINLITCGGISGVANHIASLEAGIAAADIRADELGLETTAKAEGK